MHLLPASFLAFLDFEPWMIGIVVPAAGMIFAGVIVVSDMYFKNQRRAMWHETARIALEKGQPMPLGPDVETRCEPSRPNGSANDIRAGLICIAAGAALYVFLGSFIGRGLGLVGAIPGFIGVALLLFGLIRLLGERKSGISDSRTPKS